WTRCRLYELRLVCAAPKYDGLLLGRQFNAGNFVGIKGQQAFVTQVVCGLVEAALLVARKGKGARIAGSRGIDSDACGSVVTDQELRSFLILFSDVQFDRRLSEAVLFKARGFILDGAIGAEGGKRREHAGYSVRIVWA